MKPEDVKNLKSLPARKEPERCGDGEILCKAKQILQVLLLPASFLLVGTGKIAVNAASDLAEEAKKKVEEAFKRLLLLVLLGFGLYFAWKKL